MGPKINTFQTFYTKTNEKHIKTHACGIKYQQISTNINEYQEISINNKYQQRSPNIDKCQQISTTTTNDQQSSTNKGHGCTFGCTFGLPALNQVP